MIPKFTRACLLVTILFIVCSLAACLGNKSPTPQDSSMRTAPPLQHTVQFSGETLGLISRWYTGRVQNWQIIASANPDLRPERINIGQVIYIPSHLVIQDEPLPREEVGAGAGSAEELKEVGHSGTASSFGGRVMPQDSAAEATVEAEDTSRDELLDELISDTKMEAEEAQAEVVAEPEIKDEPEAIAAEAGGVAEVETPEPEVKAEEEPSADELEREKLLDELLSQ